MSSEKISDILKKSEEDFEVKVGDGLWKQLENTHKRKYVIHTGSKGAEMFDAAIQELVKEPYRKEARELRDNKIISEEQCETLIAMIDSPDYESFELAQDLLKVKMQEHGDTIRSGGA